MVLVDWIGSCEDVGLSLCSNGSHKGGVSAAKTAIVTRERDAWNEDASFYNVHRHPVLECDYDLGVHALYNAIEKRRWDDADRIFDESQRSAHESESETLDPSRSSPSRSRAEVLAMTWVYRKSPGGDGRVKWRITVLHAAVIFDAPLGLFRKILEAHPAAATLKDDRGNLPLHLAFKSGLDEGRINLLIDAHRDSKDTRNNKGLTPVECAAFCQNRDRRRPFLTFVSSNDTQDDGSTIDTPSVTSDGGELVDLPPTMSTKKELTPATTSEREQDERDSSNVTLQHVGSQPSLLTDTVRRDVDTVDASTCIEESREDATSEKPVYAVPEADDSTSSGSTEELEESQLSSDELSSPGNHQPFVRRKSMKKKGRAAIGKMLASSLWKKTLKHRKQQQTECSQSEDSESCGSDSSKDSAESVVSELDLEDEETVLLNHQSQEAEDSDGEQSTSAGMLDATETLAAEHGEGQDRELAEEAPPILKQLSAIPECSSLLEQSSSQGLGQGIGKSINVLGEIGLGSTHMDEGERGDQEGVGNEGICQADDEQSTAVTLAGSSDDEEASALNGTGQQSEALSIKSRKERDDPNAVLSPVQEGNGQGSVEPGVDQSCTREEVATPNAAASETLDTQLGTADKEMPPPIATVISGSDHNEDAVTVMSAISTDTERMLKYSQPSNKARSGGVAFCIELCL